MSPEKRTVNFIKSSMIIELKTVVTEAVRHFLKGHTRADENDVRRIIADPTAITPLDIDAYKKYRLDIATIFMGGVDMAGVNVYLNPNSIFKEMERLGKLTPEQLHAEILLNAQQKAGEWKIKTQP